MASGMISAQRFEAGARSFAALWETCTDAEQLWTWHDAGNALDAGYLQLAGVPVSSGAVRGVEARLAGGEDEAVRWQREDTHLYNYSIAFQPSYSVPILLFSGRKLDGAPLSWEDTLRDLPAASRAAATSGDARWSFITQQEHPVTRAAMHSIHPCETATLMSLLMAQDADAGPATVRLRPDCVDTHRQTSAELSDEGGKEAGHCAEGLLRRHPKRELAVGQSMELRYLCGWYSIVAPVVGLAMPFKLWTSKAEAGNDVQ